jgi:hypothetical protein
VFLSRGFRDVDFIRYKELRNNLSTWEGGRAVKRMIWLQGTSEELDILGQL